MKTFGFVKRVKKNSRMHMVTTTAPGCHFIPTLLFPLIPYWSLVSVFRSVFAVDSCCYLGHFVCVEAIINTILSTLTPLPTIPPCFPPVPSPLPRPLKIPSPELSLLSLTRMWLVSCIWHDLFFVVARGQMGWPVTWFLALKELCLLCVSIS